MINWKMLENNEKYFVTSHSPDIEGRSECWVPAQPVRTAGSSAVAELNISWCLEKFTIKFGAGHYYREGLSLLRLSSTFIKRQTKANQLTNTVRWCEVMWGVRPCRSHWLSGLTRCSRLDWPGLISLTSPGNNKTSGLCGSFGLRFLLSGATNWFFLIDLGPSAIISHLNITTG